MVISATALSEKVPDPKLRPHGFMLRVGDLLDLDETAQQLVAAGYQRVDQVEERGQFAIRGGLLDVYPGDRGARGPRRPVRHRDRGAALVLHLHAAQPGGDGLRRDLARGRARARAPRAGRDRRDATRTGRTSPSCCPSSTSSALLDLIPERTQIIVAAEEDVEPTLRDHWEDVCTAFDDQDARDLYVNPTKINEALAERAEARLSSISQRPADRDPRAGRRLRRAQPARGRVRAREARPLATTRRSSRGRRSAPPSAPRTTSTASRRRSTARRTGLIFTEASLRDGFVAPGPQARRVPRAPADPPQEGVARGPTRKGRGLLRSFTDLRTGDSHRPRGPRHRALRRLRHQDRRRRHARLPEPRVPGRRQGLHAGRPAGEDQPLPGRRRRRADAVQARRHALGQGQGARPPRRAGARRRAAQPLRGAQAPPRPRVPGVLRGAARPRGQLPVPRDARPARRDRQRDRRHGVRAPDGPPDLRRRRLRQDRGRAARRGQGGVATASRC